MLNEGKSRGGVISGNNAVKNKTGIHAYSSQQRKDVSIKGTQSFRRKWQSNDFRDLHRMKIRYGKLRKRFDFLRHTHLDPQVFFIK